MEATLPDDQTTLGRIALRRVRRSDYELLQRTADSIIPTARRSGYLLHTCISDAFRQAAQTVSQKQPLEDVEIVIVSDMLEDCSDSLLGGKLTLEKENIAAEIRRAARIPKDTLLIDLRGTPVIAVLPASGVSALRIRQPPIDDVRRFWRAVLDHCNDDPNSFSLQTSLPQELEVQGNGSS
jgi:hypothetical protein